ncbi:MAG: hypothetical protein E7585_04200 [Ruminococcaceae bacterium]|nr:hypothetical protein [Oscillospiraceae bacterium]
MEYENPLGAYKKYYLIRLTLSFLIGILLGVLFLIGKEYAAEVFDVLLIAVGLMTAALNFFSFCYSLVRIKRRGEWISLSMSLVAILLGVLLMLLRGDIILLVLGIFTILLPAVRVMLVEERKQCLKRELPKAVFGIFMIVVFLIEAEEIVFLIAAIVTFAVALFYFSWGLATMKLRFAAIEEQLRLEEENASWQDDSEIQ